MNNLMSPEAPRTINKSFALVKVERFIRVGNQWLSENSGKPLDKAHKAVNKIERGELEKYFQISKSKVEDYLNSGKTLLLETPQRGLIRAYHAAALLKRIEEKFFANNEIVSLADYSDSSSAYFQLLSSKSLIFIQIRSMTLINHKWVIDPPNFNCASLGSTQRTPTVLRKLKLIDEVLNFDCQENSFDPSTTISRIEKAIRDKLGPSWKLCDSHHLSSFRGDGNSNSSNAVAVNTRDALSRTPQIQRMSFLSTPLSQPSQFQGNSIMPDLAGSGASGQASSGTAGDSRSLSAASCEPQTSLQTPPFSESESRPENRLGQIKLAPTIFAGGFLTGCMAGGLLPWAPMSTEALEEDPESEESSQISPRSVVPAAKMSRLMIVPGVMTPKFSPTTDTSSAEASSDDVSESTTTNVASGERGYVETTDDQSAAQYLPF